MAFAVPGSAAAATVGAPPQDPGKGVILALDIEGVDVNKSEGDVGTLGTDCTYPACGEVHNRSGHMLMVSRDANSHTSCGDIGPYAVLSNGQDSNGAPRYWKDTDCFASTDCKLFYGGRTYNPYQFIRIYNPVWIYNVNC